MCIRDSHDAYDVRGAELSKMMTRARKAKDWTAVAAIAMVLKELSDDKKA